MTFKDFNCSAVDCCSSPFEASAVDRGATNGEAFALLLLLELLDIDVDDAESVCERGFTIGAGCCCDEIDETLDADDDIVDERGCIVGDNGVLLLLVLFVDRGWIVGDNGAAEGLGCVGGGEVDWFVASAVDVALLLLTMCGCVAIRRGDNAIDEFGALGGDDVNPDDWVVVVAADEVGGGGEETRGDNIAALLFDVDVDGGCWTAEVRGDTMTDGVEIVRCKPVIGGVVVVVDDVVVLLDVAVDWLIDVRGDAIAGGVEIVRWGDFDNDDDDVSMIGSLKQTREFLFSFLNFVIWKFDLRWNGQRNCYIIFI